MKHILKSIPKTLVFASIFTFMLMNVAEATHNRAGEITYRQINALSFEITITTYTKGSSIQADRDSLELCFGDGICQWVQRFNGGGANIGNDIQLNVYKTLHAYPGPGKYVMYMTDPNRNGGILNVNYPYSDQVPFHIETELWVLNSVFSGFNNSPILTNPPIDEGCVDKLFEHNPGAYDIEGDSLSYELIVPKQGPGLDVTNYTYPNNVGGSATLYMDPITGTVSWDSPRQAGEYNLAFYINEYRNGVLISRTIRDMQITIESCNNRPPVIEPLDEICVIAGDTIKFDVIASDPDGGQLVTLSASGGPVINDGTFLGPATFTVPSPTNPIKGSFVWITECQHVQDQYYQILFKAEDNYNISPDNPQHLTDYKTVRIRVVGPPPTDVQATVQSGQVEVTWDGGYICKDSDNFNGFSVWRREGSNPFPLDTCNPGLAGKGYTKIASGVEDIDVNNRFFYMDSNVEPGRFYCYRIVGDFAEFTPSGLPYNISEGLPSDEICVQMSRDLPLMTNVSVDVTGFGNGEMYVRWSKPSPSDLDTVQNPGPYEYRLYRSDDLDGTNFQLINTSTSTLFWQANDTIFMDSGLNTSGTPYSYKVEFVSNGNSLGETSTASQIFLTVTGSDKKAILSWVENIPWEHFSYTIFKRDNASGVFDSLTTTTNKTYVDSSLVNDIEYCYYVRGEGSYNIPGIVDPLINFSQRVCAVAVDSVPPCPPTLTVTNRCNSDNFSGLDFQNDLSWTNPNNTCATDVLQYNVYYAITDNAPFTLVETIDGATNTTNSHFLDNSIAGCYYVTALDSIGNESNPSNVFCVDNCPDYSLPNVFTPNGDGPNDLYRPFEYRYIARVDMVILDRWGTVVFQTEDPDINWDGKNLQGKDVAEGVYFYKCVVFERRVSGEERSENILSGYIQIIRGK